VPFAEFLSTPAGPDPNEALNSPDFLIIAKDYTKKIRMAFLIYN